jgi:hypothetical protein
MVGQGAAGGAIAVALSAAVAVLGGPAVSETAVAALVGGEVVESPAVVELAQAASRGATRVSEAVASAAWLRLVIVVPLCPGRLSPPDRQVRGFGIFGAPRQSSAVTGLSFAG